MSFLINSFRFATVGSGLLDTYTGSKMAWSLRTLKTGVTNVVRVRRSSDSAESDFTAAQLTESIATVTSLLYFVTVNNTVPTADGFVRTWYDQSGNAHHIGQATAGSQPKIVSAGTYLARVDFTNGKTLTLGTGVDVFGTNTKACWFEVTNYNVGTTGGFSDLHIWGTVSNARTWSDGATDMRLYGPGVANQIVSSYFEKGAFKIYHYATNAGGTDTDGVTQRIRSYKNAASAGTNFNNNKDHWSTELFLQLGGTMTAAHTFERKEFIIFDDDKTDFANIITAINTHYAIY